MARQLGIALAQTSNLGHPTAGIAQAAAQPHAQGQWCDGEVPPAAIARKATYSAAASGLDVDSGRGAVENTLARQRCRPHRILVDAESARASDPERGRAAEPGPGCHRERDRKIC